MESYVVGRKHPDDVVIVSALRTPMTKGRKGGLKDTEPEYMLSVVLKAVVDSVGLDPSLVEDIVIGSVLSPGSGATEGRMAMLYAGFPESVSVCGLNRQCASGLQAVAQIAQAIRNDTIEIGIGAGVESMTRNYFNTRADKYKYSEDMMKNPQVQECLIPMGIMSDNVAQEFLVSRREQDELAVLSHKRAAKAQKLGLFKEEIVPVETYILDKDGKKSKVTVIQDDGIREDVSLESLSKLKPAFGKDGTTTAGTSSQISDGAAAVLLMKRSRAAALGLPIIGKYVCSAAIGLPIRILGIGPVYAVPEALKKANLSIDDLDIIELNEAFASQAVYCIKKLGLDINKVNPKGGAIAIGHPLGTTGARQIATLLTELHRTKKRLGAVTMCAGLGNGMCSIFEAEY
ncbi:hypothetical protein BB560_001895 [Smittium megazygosporum]|uniref:3-ketoacyl-CoA thiolase n=1 Tax=Smittium megazygosporum TaxID=133381 RepID=A0A2T9ZG95_9FUNG|nr:hypothetical protein BB560_001898 [Smittium megazygosporum]PVV03619.1 hypothetical protein BB560_001895 [Smittium megazygosporum]